MNLRRLCDEIIEYWSGPEFEILESDSEHFRICASVGYEKFYGDRSIDLEVYVYATGALHVFFTIGTYNYMYKNSFYEKLNEFNRKCAWFKAYVGEENSNGDCEVSLHYSLFETLTEEPNEQRVLDFVNFGIGQLLDENFYNDLEDILDELD